MPEPRSPRPDDASRSITSLQNESVKFIRALEMRKARRETGLFVAEGASVLLTAREHGWQPKTLVLGPEAGANAASRGLATWARAAQAEILDVAAPVLAKIAAKENPQSVIGVFEQRWAAAPDPARCAAGALWLALEEVRDPGNLGTIIRTVDAVGATGIMLVGNCCDPYAHECIRATMGSIFALPPVRVSREAFLAWRRGWPGDVIGTHLSAKEDFRTVRYRSPTLLVMGGEGPGLTPELTAACDRLVKIPMAGKLDSLNLAVATALTLYQIRGAKLAL